MHARFPSVPALALAGLVVALGCKDGGGSGPDPVPTTITIAPATTTLNALGATQQLSATVKDQQGRTMTGQTVSWTSSNTAAATVNGSGLVTAVANGSADVTATAGSASGSASITVAQAAAAVAIVSGDAQSATVMTAAADSLVARVNDARGNAVPGVAIAFATSTGGGMVTPSNGTTNAQGRASTQWTFPALAGAHTVTATSGTASGQFTGTATADAADSLLAVSGDGQVGTVNATLPDPLVVRVVDQYGNAVAGHAITFATGAGSGSVAPTNATTDAAGEASTNWTLGPTLGAQSASAAAGGLKDDPLAFTATGQAPQPSSLEIVDGGGQTGLLDSPVNVPPLVRVLDAGGNPYAGATVTFSVTAGGGSVTGGVVVSDADGLAEVGAWTIKSGSNSLQAAVTGVPPVSFMATGQAAAFDIELRFINTPDPTHQQAFTDAEAKWEEAIFGDLVDQLVQQDSATLSNNCGVDVSGGIDETIDDLVIYVKLEPIDGPFGVVGQAGPCLVRNSYLPVVGRMIFDTDDLDYLNGQGQLKATILHEMGHVLGIGPLWDASLKALVEQPSDTIGPIVDTYYVGEWGLWAFDRVGGDSYSGGASVPVENDNTKWGLASLNVHWRETVFESELMTPELDNGVPNPLSLVSIASTSDLGYVSNYSASETYALPPAPPPLAAGASSRLVLKDDVLLGPITVVGSDGRIVRVISR